MKSLVRLLVLLCTLSGVFSSLSASSPSLSSLSSPSSPLLRFNVTQTKVVFLKTHKTASTTVASLIFRFGHNHGLRFLPSTSHYISLFDESLPKGPFDITLYHHHVTDDPNSGQGYYYQHMKTWYDSRVPNAQYISVVRDPVKRQISEYYYFFEPEDVTVQQYITGDHPKRERSDVTKDLGIFTVEAAKEYIASDFNGVFMLVTEMLPESLLLMQRHMGWSMHDILYLHLLDACKGNVTRWDGKAVRCAPKDPPAELISAIKERTEAEQMIYDAAKNKLVKMIEQQPPEFHSDLVTYKAMLNELQQQCQPYFIDITPESIEFLANIDQALAAIPLQCYLYLIPDMVYERLILQASQNNVPLNSMLPILSFN